MWKENLNTVYDCKEYWFEFNAETIFKMYLIEKAERIDVPAIYLTCETLDQCDLMLTRLKMNMMKSGMNVRERVLVEINSERDIDIFINTIQESPEQHRLNLDISLGNKHVRNIYDFFGFFDD